MQSVTMQRELKTRELTPTLQVICPEAADKAEPRSSQSRDRAQLTGGLTQPR